MKSWLSTSGVTVAVSLIVACSSQPEQPPPFPQPDQSCSVELTNRSGQAADVWYDPGHEPIGMLQAGQKLVFGANCSHGSIAIYGEHHNAAGGRSGLACSSVRLRPGETAEASLNSPREICHDPASVR